VHSWEIDQNQPRLHPHRRIIEIPLPLHDSLAMLESVVQHPKSMHHRFIQLFLIATFSCTLLKAATPPNQTLFSFWPTIWVMETSGATVHKFKPPSRPPRREGVRFSDFYAAQPVCSASRAALLTGCYPNRIGLLGALGPRSRIALNTNEVTIRSS